MKENIFKKSIVKDIVLFIVIVVVLMIVVPAISSILKHLFVLQLIIVIVGAIALRYLVKTIRSKTKW